MSYKKARCKVMPPRLEDIKYLTRLTKQLWSRIYLSDDKLWQCLSPNCRMQNKFGPGGRGADGLIPCMSRLSEIGAAVREAGNATRDVVKVISDTLTCILITVGLSETSPEASASFSSDWSVGFAFEWEWGRVVGIVFMHSVDPANFIDNIVRRHAITLRQGAFTAVDEAKFRWHKWESHRALRGVVLAVGELLELKEILAAAGEECPSFEGKTEGEVLVSVPAVGTALVDRNSIIGSPSRKKSNAIESKSKSIIIKTPTPTPSADEVSSSDSATLSSVDPSLPKPPSPPSREGRRNSWAKYNSNEKKKVRFASALISYLLVPKVVNKPISLSKPSELFYTPMDFKRFLSNSDTDLAQVINTAYRLHKRMISLNEARALLYQPQGVVLYDNSTNTLEDVPLYETMGIPASNGTHDLDAMCHAIRKQTTSTMLDEVERTAVQNNYGKSVAYDAEHVPSVADVIIPQHENNKWYISKYARMAYRKLVHKEVGIGGGLIETHPLVTLRHGSNIVRPEFDARNKNMSSSASYSSAGSNAGSEPGSPTAHSFTHSFSGGQEECFPPRSFHHTETVHYHRLQAYSAYMLGCRVEPPFFVRRPAGGDLTQLYVTVIGCKNLKSPFIRLLPRPVNSFVEMKIGGQKLHTETKHTDLNPLYDCDTTFLFELEGIYQDALLFDQGLLQLTVFDSCFSVSKIGRTWIPLSAIEFSADESSPTLITVPIIFGGGPTYLGTCYQTDGQAIAPVASTTAASSERSHNDLLQEHAKAESDGGNGSPPAMISVLVSKVNCVLHWMLEEMRMKDEERDKKLVDEESNRRATATHLADTAAAAAAAGTGADTDTAAAARNISKSVEDEAKASSSSNNTSSSNNKSSISSVPDVGGGIAAREKNESGCADYAVYDSWLL
jgi:hypothetical protein